MSGKKVVVIGGDACGMSAASRAKRRDPELRIVAFEMGENVSYGACGIPYAVSGEIPEIDSLVVLTPEQFEHERGIKAHLHHRVEEIDRGGRKVLVRDLVGDRVFEEPYDQLVYATGAAPIIPPEVNPALPGLFTIRNVTDAHAVRNFIDQKKPKTGLIIGAGYIGLEMTESLVAAGVETTVVDCGGRVMCSAEDEISQVLGKELQAHGVGIVTRSEVAGRITRKGGKLQMGLSSGHEVQAEMVIIGIGVRPMSELAEAAGLKLGVKGAVAVDRNLRTSDPAIFAGGDCAEAFHRVLGRNAYLPLALGANRQGRVIGDNLAGEPTEFPGVLGSAVSKVFGQTVARTGLGFEEARAEGLDVIKVVVRSPSHPGYMPDSGPNLTVVVADRDSKKPVGVQMVGRQGVSRRIDIWGTALATGLSLAEIGDLDLAYAPPYSPVWDPVLVAAQVANKKVS